MKRKQKQPHRAPVMISFVGPSNAGKTTLLVNLIRELTQRGFKIGAVKHSRAGFQLDIEGKDSANLKQAGARAVLLAGPRSIGFIADYSEELSPSDIGEKFFCDADIVLVEGWKESDLPKILVSEGGSPLTNIKNVIAEVGKRGSSATIPHFAPNEINRLADFILSLRSS